MKDPKCLFCKIAAHEIPSALVYEDDKVLAFLDLFPATRGHTLVMPKEHYETVYTLPPDIGGHLMGVAIKIANSIKGQFKPAGLNMVQSNGEFAGQIIPHFHLHLIPRYENDGFVIKYGQKDKPADSAELKATADMIKMGMK